MDKKDIEEFWNDSFVQFNAEVLSKYPLKQETKEFLRLIGLPIDCRLLKELNISFHRSFKQISIKNCNYIEVGDDYGTRLCISEKENEVVSIDNEGDMNIQFVNSSIIHFINFLQLYFTRRPELLKADDEEAVEIVKLIRRNFNRFDALALSDKENWWAVILEQTEQGLL